MSQHPRPQNEAPLTSLRVLPVTESRQQGSLNTLSLTPILLPFSNLQSRSGSLSTLSCGCTHTEMWDWTGLHSSRSPGPLPSPAAHLVPFLAPPHCALACPMAGIPGPVFLLRALTACKELRIQGKQ